MKPYYEHEGIAIYHGDCRDILPSLPKVDLVLTDPPYGVGFTGKVTRNVRHSDGYANTIGDDVQFIDDVVIPVIQNCLAMCPREAIFCGNRMLWHYPPARDIGCFYVQFGGRVGPWGFGSVNLVLFYGTDPFLERGLGSRPNSWMSSEIAERNGHPCPKPLGWMRKLVVRASFEDELILDPFMGSGTTLRAAKDLGRKAIGIEIEERYCEIAAKRMAQSVMAL